MIQSIIYILQRIHKRESTVFLAHSLTFTFLILTTFIVQPDDPSKTTPHDFSTQLAATDGSADLELVLILSPTVPQDVLPAIAQASKTLQEFAAVDSARISFRTQIAQPYSKEAMECQKRGVTPIPLIQANPGIHIGKYYFFGLIISTKQVQKTINPVSPGDRFEFELAAVVSELKIPGIEVSKELFGKNALPTGTLGPEQKAYADRIQKLDLQYQQEVESGYVDLKQQQNVEIESLEKNNLNEIERLKKSRQVFDKYQVKGNLMRQRLNEKYRLERDTIEFEYLDRIQFIPVPQSIVEPSRSPMPGTAK